MKNGARRDQQNEIKRRAAAGHSAHEISESMRITVECVKNFMGNEKEKEDDSNDDSLEGKTNAQLKELLDAEGIEYGANDTKAELLALFDEE